MKFWSKIVFWATIKQRQDDQSNFQTNSQSQNLFIFTGILLRTLAIIPSSLQIIISISESKITEKMFTLQIHTVDFPQPLHDTFTSTTSATAASSANNNLKPAQLMGVAHLFRQLPSATVPAVTVANVTARTTRVFVVAVPNYFSSNDFLLFCGNHVPHFVDILFLR